MNDFFPHIWKLCILAVLFSCTEEPTKFETKVISSQYALTLADYLQPIDELNDDAPLQLGDNLREVYLVGRYNTWEDLRKRHATWELEDYYDFHIENLLLDVQNPIAPGPDSISINGLNGLKGFYQGRHLNDNIYCKLVLIESEEYLYQLLLWTVVEKKELYEADMDKIIHSFREI